MVRSYVELIEFDVGMIFFPFFFFGVSASCSKSIQKIEEVMNFLFTLETEYIYIYIFIKQNKTHQLWRNEWVERSHLSYL